MRVFTGYYLATGPRGRGRPRSYINRPNATLTVAAGTVRVAFAIASAKETSLQAFGTTAAGANFMYDSTQTLNFPAGATRASNADLSHPQRR